MTWEDLAAGDFGARADIAGVDPNLVWADATAFADFLRSGQQSPTFIPVIVALKKDSHNQAVDALARLSHELSALNAGSIPTIWSITPATSATFSAGIGKLGIEPGI